MVDTGENSAILGLFVALLILLGGIGTGFRTEEAATASDLVMAQGQFGFADSSLPQVFIYHDERYPTTWYSKNEARYIAEYLSELLGDQEIPYRAVNADELRRVALEEDPRRSILVFAQGLAPDTVWDGTSSSAIVRWLWKGATILWTGDLEFWYIGHSDDTFEHAADIETIPFGRSVSVGADVRIESTELGSRYLPSLEDFVTARPFSEDLLAGLEYESYGHAYVGSTRVIDPGLIRVENGTFAKVGMTHAGGLDVVSRAIFIGELLLNRFLGQNRDLTEGKKSFHPYDSGIVYILPSGASTPYWKQTCGIRECFYAYANVSDYESEIVSDLAVITERYRFLILILTMDDGPQFYYNLKKMDSWAMEQRLKIFYTVNPKWAFGPEEEYLNIGSAVYRVLVKNYEFLANLSSTFAVSTGYGWPGRAFVPAEIERFYESLPTELKMKYVLWLDQSYVLQAKNVGFPPVASRMNITVVTELYYPDYVALLGSLFEKQIVVSGYYNASSAAEWRRGIERKIDRILVPATAKVEDRRLGIWMFWDVDDGNGELYRTYINGTLENPLLGEPPSTVVLDETAPTAARVNVGSPFDVKFHFSWPNGLPASHITVQFPEVRIADEKGWAIVAALAVVTAKRVVAPEGAAWGPHPLTIETIAELPSIVWDRIAVRLSSTAERVSVGDNATVRWDAWYEYDGTPLEGSVTLDHPLTQERTGAVTYNVASVTDRKYGLTAFTSNSVVVIFDRVVVQLASASERVPVGMQASISWQARYESDGEPFNGEVALEGALSQDFVGPVVYRISSVTDWKYGLTAFTANSVVVIFDEMRYGLQLSNPRPGLVHVRVSLWFASDSSPVEDALVVVNGHPALHSGKGIYEVDLEGWGTTHRVEISAQAGEFEVKATLSDSMPYNLAGIVAIVVTPLVAIGVFLWTRHRKKKSE